MRFFCVLIINRRFPYTGHHRTFPDKCGQHPWFIRFLHLMFLDLVMQVAIKRCKSTMITNYTILTQWSFTRGLPCQIVQNGFVQAYNNYCSGTALVLLWYWLGTAFAITKIHPRGNGALTGWKVQKTVAEQSQQKPADKFIWIKHIVKEMVIL